MVSAARTHAPGAALVPHVRHLIFRHVAPRLSLPQPAGQGNGLHVVCRAGRFRRYGCDARLPRFCVLGHRHTESHLLPVHDRDCMVLLRLAAYAAHRFQSLERNAVVQFKTTDYKYLHPHQQQPFLPLLRQAIRRKDGGLLQPGQQMDGHGLHHPYGYALERGATRFCPARRRQPRASVPRIPQDAALHGLPFLPRALRAGTHRPRVHHPGYHREMAACRPADAGALRGRRVYARGERVLQLRDRQGT